jgi:hypothetical protein
MATSLAPPVSRRHFLRCSSGLAGAAFLGALQGCKIGPDTLLIGGYQSPGASFGVGAIDVTGVTRWKLASPARVHGPSLEPNLKIGAVAARRPGYFIQVFSAESGTLLEEIQPPKGIFFEGHVEFSGNRLWATAAREKTCEALLLSWDLASLLSPPDLRLLPGIGPHQILNHHERLWLAVGGWKTENRVVTNADNFESFLLEVNPNSGTINNHGNPAPGLSLRHLGAHQGQIYAGMQYATPGPSDHPLVYQFDSNTWTALATPSSGWEIFIGYIASVAVNANQIMATSPQGHYIGLWDRHSLHSINTEKVLDASAAIDVGDTLKAASGVGVMVDANNLSVRTRTDFHWDNHWASYTPA